MKAYFVDLNCLLKVENKAWIVDKSKPNIPIMKLPKEDFNLYKSGIYKSQGNKIEFNGKTFWLPSDVFNKLKVKLKNNNLRISNLAISMQEFMNKELIENLQFEINEEMVSKLKNKLEDIYVVCSKQTKNSYELLLEKLTKKFEENGIAIKNYYHISETFYNQKDDDILFKKARLYLQHLVGFKTDGKIFDDEELVRYDEIKVYDTDSSILHLKQDLNKIFKLILNNTKDGLKSVIKENCDDYKPKLEINHLTDNVVNKVIKEKVALDYSNLVKNFESFKAKYM